MKESIDKLWRRMQLVVARGRITTVKDSGAVQMAQVQIGALETRDNTPRVAEYGFTSNPLEGCHGVMIFVGGDRSNGVIIATNDQNARLKNLKRGEVAIYDDQGQSVYLTRAGIVVNGAGLPLSIMNTASIAMNATGAIALTSATLTHNGVNVGDTHVHGGIVPGGADTLGPQ